jgi:hypothetical protein
LKQCLNLYQNNRLSFSCGDLRLSLCGNLGLSFYKLFISISNLFAISGRRYNIFMRLIVFFDDFLQQEINNTPNSLKNS